MPINDFNFFKRKKNRFWKDNELIEKDSIRKSIDIILNHCEINCGSSRVNVVYLFGSVLELKDKQHYIREPKDFDMYFWINGNGLFPSRNLVRTTKGAAKSVPKPYNLEIDTKISTLYPWNNYIDDFAEHLNSVYILYTHPRLEKQIKR